MATVNDAGQGITVAPHVRAFVDACGSATGAVSFGTYNGHEPDGAHAIDIHCSPSLGDSVSAFAIANIDRFGIDYVIWEQRIWNPEILNGWRAMGDRGNATQNHFDHVHVSFEMAIPSGLEGATVPHVQPINATDSDYPGLTRAGSYGGPVRRVQTRLRERGWSIKVDGLFGPITDGIVREFQTEKFGAGPDVDGIVGPKTWEALVHAPIT